MGVVVDEGYGSGSGVTGVRKTGNTHNSSGGWVSVSTLLRKEDPTPADHLWKRKRSGGPDPNPCLGVRPKPQQRYHYPGLHIISHI